jgi:hypothetical protein
LQPASTRNDRSTTDALERPDYGLRARFGRQPSSVTDL